MTRAELSRDLQRRPRDRAARHPDEEAFLARETARERKRVLLPRFHDAIDDAPIEVGGNEAGTHALKLMLTALFARQHRRPRRLDRDDENVGATLLQKTTDAADRAASSRAVHERVDAS